MKLDRRAVLGWTAVVAGAIGAGTGLRAYLGAGSAQPPATPAPGYGKDPVLLEPAPGPWPRLLTERQKAWLTQRLDALLPKSGSLPSASEAGLAEFFDEWLSAPYPDQQADRALILPLAEGKADPAAEDRLRVLALAAFYTTPAGIAAIGFVGNEPRERFDPLPAAVTEHLERQFALLPEKPA
ncbi:hypothetical protein ACLBKU_16505 [Erythrobacter sp. NE805]|uniref:hypothetical protein n=1 Tax=Erythrobacter sp. NE805 TaxID=3389875 RepID=UPI00396B0116